MRTTPGPAVGVMLRAAVLRARFNAAAPHNPLPPALWLHAQESNSSLQSLVRAKRILLALVDPALHADLAEVRARLVEAVVDVRAQGVQRELAVHVSVLRADLSSAE